MIHLVLGVINFVLYCNRQTKSNRNELRCKRIAHCIHAEQNLTGFAVQVRTPQLSTDCFAGAGPGAQEGQGQMSSTVCCAPPHDHRELIHCLQVPPIQPSACPEGSRALVLWNSSALCIRPRPRWERDMTAARLTRIQDRSLSESHHTLTKFFVRGGRRRLAPSLYPRVAEGTFGCAVMSPTSLLARTLD